MKSIKFLTVVVAIATTVGFVLVTKNANAYVTPDSSNKKLVVCGSGDENGTTTMGNTCTSGSNVCISNPCN
jgi:hypothetical protein